MGNNEPVCIADEVPFEIPESWEWCRLGCIGDWGSGATPSRTNPEFYDGDIPWLKTGDLNDGYVYSVPECVSKLALEKTSIRLNPAGSVLIAMYGATIGKLGIAAIPITTNQACCACLPYEGIINEYLFYFLMSQKVNFVKKGEGGAQPNISKEKIVATFFPVPPQNEQQRIIEKLKEILPKIDAYQYAEAAVNKLNSEFPGFLKKSILQQAVMGKLVPQDEKDEPAAVLLERIRAEKDALIKAGKLKKDKHESIIYRRDNSHYEKLDGMERCIDDEIPFEIPDSWSWCRIKDIFETSSGTTPSKSNSSYYDLPKYNWVRTTDLNNDVLTTCEIKISKKAFEECRLEVLPYDSVCIAMYGGAGTIGKNALIRFETTINQSVCAIHPNGFINMEYVQLYIKYLRPEWMRYASGSRKDPNINQVIIKNMLIPIPPINEQIRIVISAQRVMNSCEKM